MYTLIAIGFVMATMGLAYSFLSGLLLGLRQKPLELAIAAMASILVPPIGGYVLQRIVSQNLRKSGETLLVWTVLSAIALVLLPAAFAILMHLLGRNLAFWQINSERALVAVLLLHAAVSVLLLLRPFDAAVAKQRGFLSFDAVGGGINNRPLLFIVFLVCLFFAIAVLFHVEPTNQFLNSMIQLFVRPTFAPEITVADRIEAIGIGGGIVALAILIARAEQHWARAVPRRLDQTHKVLIPVFLIFVCIYYFDFALLSDPMHYLTNVSPAMLVMHGGVPPVDAFSQYGPGPVLMTVTGFAVGPETLGTANIVVQIHNLAFFTVILLCLTRLVNAKIAALVLGFAAIGVLLGGWGSGQSNLASAPSNMGFRYLWPAVMVLAISHLPMRRLHSVWTALASAAAALWSIETLVGTLAVQLAFIAAVRAREHAFVSLFLNAVRALAPAAAAVILFSVVIRAWSGTFPDYSTYLQFLTVYNTFSDYWAIQASGTFWGWVPMVLALVVVAMFVWKSILTPEPERSRADTRTLLNGYLPLATLTALMSLYYLGRSVDFVLILAFLPFSAFVIAAYLHSIAAWQNGGQILRAAVILLSAAMIWASTYGIHSLYGPKSVYRLAWHECRIDGRCSPQTLVRELGRAVREQPPLETISYIGSHGQKLLKEAGWAITMTAAGQERVAVFLGRTAGRSLATDLALLRAGKAHRWPISYTFTDELVGRLVERIVTAPVQLREGEIVIVRRDETLLGPLERAILRKIRSEVLLCPEDTADAEQIVLYRASRRQSCGEM